MESEHWAFYVFAFVFAKLDFAFSSYFNAISKAPQQTPWPYIFDTKQWFSI